MRSSGKLPRAATCLAILILGTAWTSAAQAGETRGFLVSWFYTAQYFDEKGRDCPKGLNPTSTEIYRRELTRMGKSAQEIEEYNGRIYDLQKLPQNAPLTTMRGVRDGKPANVYIDPESTSDPNLFTVEGPYGYGFNLDGKEKPADFTDPDTGEKGVDNQLYRVQGCIRPLRPLSATEHAQTPGTYWNLALDTMQAVLIEVSGIDDAQNDDDVTVGFYHAQERTLRDSSGKPMADMTYRVDPNPRWTNTLRGKIKNGVITTEIKDVTLGGDPIVMPEFQFIQARLRLQINADGSLKGMLGGYHKWFPIYWLYGSGGWVIESQNSQDLPGYYYALKKMADADPDPVTGQNTSISLAYQIDAVPAFVVHEPVEIGAATPPSTQRAENR
jgi:hypothetical protein